MPMWLHKRRPTPPPPRPNASATPGQLHDALIDAVLHDDMAGARQVFEQAFWDKVAFTPDGYHLLNAVRRGNREMIRLLATHGAAWTAEETKIARLLCGPAAWSAAETELRRAGIRTQFNETELKTVDAFAVTDWARRLVEHAERLGLSEAAKARVHFEGQVLTGAGVFIGSGKHDLAQKLLEAGGASFGDGSQEKPFKLDMVIEIMSARGPAETARVLAFIDHLAAQGRAVAPITLSGTAVWHSPQLLKELGTRGILSAAQYENRMNLLRNWSCIQRKVDIGGSDIELPQDFVERQHAAWREAAGALFNADRRLSDAEAGQFMRLHAARAKQTPEGLARMDKALFDLGFFADTAFTAGRLRELAAAAPADEKNLSARFNHLASVKLLNKEGIENFLSPAKFHEVLEAHKNGAWRAGPEETRKILDYLAAQVKKDAVPDGVVAALQILRDGGAVFSNVDPNRYIGKSAPGLCKVLLDQGLVQPRQIDIEKIARRHDGELRPLTLRGTRAYADQEFMCQVILESMMPGKYIPLRGTAEAGYQRLFIREYGANPAVRRRFMSFRRGTNSSGPR